MDKTVICMLKKLKETDTQSIKLCFVYQFNFFNIFQLIFNQILQNKHVFTVLALVFVNTTPASTTQNIECPFIMTPSKMGKTKNVIFCSLNIRVVCAKS